MKTAYFYIPLAFLAALLLYAAGCDDDGLPDGPGGDSVSASADIDANGGYVELTDSHGNEISLHIPYGAVDNGTTVTVTATATRLEKQITSNILPGITIAPEDLLLRYPAQLSIRFYNVEGWQEGVLYCINPDELLMPLDEHTVENGTGIIRGNIYYFGEYAAGIPTEQEMLAQIRSAKQAWSRVASRKTVHAYASGDCPPNAYGWQGLRTEVAGLLYWQNRFAMLGNESAAQEAGDLVKAEVERSIESFENQNLPDDLCGNYARAAFNYYQSAEKLGVETDDLKSLTDQLWNQCALRFKITIDYELDDSDPPEVEKESRYATATCYVPYEEFLSDPGSASVKGDGTVTYSDDYEWLYNPNQNWKVTEKKEGRGTITCTGSAALVSPDNVYPTQEYVWKATISLAAEEKGSVEVCDTKYDDDPEQESCQKTDYTKDWRDGYSVVLNGAGATLRDEQLSGDGVTMQHVVTLQWLNPPGFESEDDGKCY